LFETFLPSHGGAEGDTFIVEQKWVKGVVVAAQEILLVKKLVATRNPAGEELR